MQCPLLHSARAKKLNFWNANIPSGHPDECTIKNDLEPILRLQNLQLQRQRCRRLDRFFKVEENTFALYSKSFFYAARKHTCFQNSLCWLHNRGVVNSYSTGVVTLYRM
jgi:hypothetical protein